MEDWRTGFRKGAGTPGAHSLSHSPGQATGGFDEDVACGPWLLGLLDVAATGPSQLWPLPAAPEHPWIHNSPARASPGQDGLLKPASPPCQSLAAGEWRWDHR